MSLVEHTGKNWKSYIQKELLSNNMVDETDMELFFVTDRAEDAVDEICRFYKRYHSSRYVDDQFVIRLNQPLSEETVAEINTSFADILSEGCFEQVVGPLEGEDEAYPGKSRLVCMFNRRSAGRIRLLINKINEAP